LTEVAVTEVRIPRLGFSVAEVSITEWLVGDGEEVAAGQPIYVVESDKVESEIESPVGGRLRIVSVAGGPYPVGSLVAEIR
jgi:pyruvate/2-oxoglutarate dehydrogenase complex dihydrolipoamide acyltransferase (E2) component